MHAGRGEGAVMTDHCIACGQPCQPGIDYCLECDVELAESFEQAREYAENYDYDGDSPDTTDYRCRDSRQCSFTF